MRILYVASEIFPLAKTGGLADVGAALPQALRQSGLDVRLLMPAYPQALARAFGVHEYLRLGDPLGWGETRLLAATLPDSDVPVWLVDCPKLYNRGGGPYQDATGRDWHDNHLRFALLAHVAAALACEPGGRWRPDIVHANDWHCGLIPILLSQSRGPKPPVVFTIHNLAYQGLFDEAAFDALALPETSRADLAFYSRISFLKAGLRTADVVTTVSPTYAAEILTPEYGCGLESVLEARAAPPSGILNGIDSKLWDPQCDRFLPARYSSHDMGGKQLCKDAIRAELGLVRNSPAPLAAFMSRLTHQKMPDLMLEALPALLADGLQFALLADGEAAYQDAFLRLAERYPGQVAVRIGYREDMAHRLLAGADLLLHPSRFEPCGLVPLYAMRYGTIPVARRCGGLADTVVDATKAAIRDGTATGFAFDGSTVADLQSAVRRAAATYQQSLVWRRLSATAMTRDFSWQRTAEVYQALYRSLVEPGPDDQADCLAEQPRRFLFDAAVQEPAVIQGRG